MTKAVIIYDDKNTRQMFSLPADEFQDFLTDSLGSCKDCQRMKHAAVHIPESHRVKIVFVGFETDGKIEPVNLNFGNNRKNNNRKNVNRQ